MDTGSNHANYHCNGNIINIAFDGFCIYWKAGRIS